MAKALEKAVQENLMAIVGAYRRATGKSLSQVSKEFYGRGDFFDRFKAGQHSISVQRLSEMLTQFRQQWPDGEPWPYTRPVHMTRQSPR